MELTNDLIISKWCELSPDKDDDRTKSFKIELTIPKGTTVNDMALAILVPTIIKWQNARRPKWDKLVDKSTHKLTFKRPVSEIDPEDAMVALLQGMTPEEQKAKIHEMVTKANK